MHSKMPRKSKTKNKRLKSDSSRPKASKPSQTTLDVDKVTVQEVDRTRIEDIKCFDNQAFHLDYHQHQIVLKKFKPNRYEEDVIIQKLGNYKISDQAFRMYLVHPTIHQREIFIIFHANKNYCLLNAHQRDVIVQYGTNENKPIATRCERFVAEPPFELSNCLSKQPFNQGYVELWKIPYCVVYHILTSETPSSLNTLVQTEERVDIGTPSSSNQDMKFQPNGSLSDIKVILTVPNKWYAPGEGATSRKEIMMDKIVLIHHSTFFRQWINEYENELQEGFTLFKNVPQITLPLSVDETGFTLLQNYMYNQNSFKLMQLNFEQSVRLFKVCEILEVNSLRIPLRERLRFLMETGEKEFLQVLVLAEEHKSLELQKSIVHVYRKVRHKIVQLPEWTTFCKERPDAVLHLIELMCEL